MSIAKTLFFVSLICFMPGVSFSASTASDYQIRLFVGSDTTPPTTPGIMSATAIAPTQINITWSASTDDVILSGYRVYRDGAPIATTTLTTFSDTSAVPETTYIYTVDAFD